LSSRITYRTVDVFTDRPLAGNALCVVLDDCPEDVMQAIALEVNLSETTFPVITGADSYRMRIFTPRGELPFAGHPSLGTAWVLGPNRWAQTTPGATVAVTADERGAVMEQPEPVLTLIDGEDEAVCAALGIDSIEGVWLSSAGGTQHLLAPTAASLDELAPRSEAIAEVAVRLGATGLAPFRRDGAADLEVRVFVPGAGVPGDPGTGSAAGPIARLAGRLWDVDDDVTIRQGQQMGRPCIIRAHAGADGIRVGGDVTLVAEGQFVL
jgi:trans-2,3-dihydro-3-hydroxyanthranilate isomerase